MDIEIRFLKNDKTFIEKIKHQDIYDLWFVLLYANDRLIKEGLDETEMGNNCDRLSRSIARFLDRLD